MRVAVLTSASAGGAGIAAERVAHGLRTHAGMDVQLVDVGAIGAVAPEVSVARTASNERLSNTLFTADHATASRDWVVRFLAGFDVVNLHWTSFLLSAREIDALARTGTPMLLTMHDFNHVTGGCHYPAGCTGLLRGCTGCPQVDPEQFAPDAVRRLKQRKDAMLRRANVHLAAPSRYVLDLAARAVQADAGRLHLLRNPYAPLDLPRSDAADRPFTVLLVADSLVEQRKGATLAGESLQLFCALIAGRVKVRIHVAGKADPGLIRALRSTGAELHAHGRVTEHSRLASIYVDSDVQISTSHEDNWPNVLVEAGAYGCLAVVGPGHGCEEFARLYPGCHVADDYSPAAFARELQQVAELPAELRRQRQDGLRDAVRRDHAPAAVAAAYAQALQATVGSAAWADAAAAAQTRPRGELSSNYLGFATRELLAAAPRPADGRLVVRVARPATSSHALTLRAVYGGQRVEDVVVHTLVDGAATVALNHGGAPLRHVFATELSDYGLSTLTCGFEAAPTPP